MSMIFPAEPPAAGLVNAFATGEDENWRGESRANAERSRGRASIDMAIGRGGGRKGETAGQRKRTSPSAAKVKSNVRARFRP